MKHKPLACSCLLLLMCSLLAAQQHIPLPNLPCGIPSTTAFTNWVEFRYDNCHSGYNPNEFLLGSATAGKLVFDWSYKTGAEVRSSPAVANGVVFIASDDLYALNSTTGELLWKYPNVFTVSSPAVANGMVYVGSSDANLYAVHAATGTLLWKYTTGGAVTSSPTVVNGSVYVASTDANVYALDARTGALLWKFATEGISITSSPAVANGVLYIGAEDHIVRSGVAVEEGSVRALDAATGTLLWIYPTLTWIDSSPAVSNGIVYAGSLDGTFYALNSNDGSLLWQFTAGDHNLQSSPAVAGGVVYFGSTDGNIYALNAKTGDLLWQYTTGGAVISSPAVANGVVYVGSYDGNSLYALNASTGALLWSYNVGDVIESSPAVVNGMVYVGSYDANLYAFHLPN